MQAMSTPQCGEVRFSAPMSRNNPITTGESPWRLSGTFPHVRGVQIHPCPRRRSHKILLAMSYVRDHSSGSRKAGGCLTFLLHSTECSTETKGKEKEKGERANKVRFKTFFICSQRREREKREREEKTPMFE